MGKIKIYLTIVSVITLVCILFSINSCKKSVYTTATPSCNDGIQNQNETGIDCGGVCSSFAATVNGNNFAGWMAQSNGNPGFVLITANTSTTNISATYNDNISILFQLANITTTGTYTLASSTSTNRYGQYTTGAYTTQIIYRTDSIHIGTVTFTKVDMNKRVLSGTFNFTATQYSPIGTGTVSITNGSFTDICW